MSLSQVRKEILEKFVQTHFIPVQDLELLNVALTHTSFANEQKNIRVQDNERLEFLGDAVLDLVIGEYLFKKYPDWKEGDLTRAKASVVCESSLAECGKRFGIGECLLLGKGEELSGGRERHSILADAVESLIGAIYLNQSYAKAMDFIMKHLARSLSRIDNGTYSNDYKTELQEYAQRHGKADLKYRLVRDEGPDHDKTFYIHACLNGQDIGAGVGKSKKAAAQQAAKEAVEYLKGLE